MRSSSPPSFLCVATKYHAVFLVYWLRFSYALVLSTSLFLTNSNIDPVDDPLPLILVHHPIPCPLTMSPTQTLPLPTSRPLPGLSLQPSLTPAREPRPMVSTVAIETQNAPTQLCSWRGKGQMFIPLTPSSWSQRRAGLQHM